MRIHEYEAKRILSRYGVPVPRGGLARDPEEASRRTVDVGGSAWVVKAQIHAGGRGEAGGVALCRSDREAHAAARSLLGSRLVTRQSPTGRPVERVYIEQAIVAVRELYLGMMVDRATESMVILASAEGGVDVEALSTLRPEAVRCVTVDPAVGLLDFQARDVAAALGMTLPQVAEACQIVRGAYRAFRDLDATMLEINPLAVTEDGGLVALDAKMSFDDNALFRHPRVAELRDRGQEDPRETIAADRGLAYVGLDGDIGCIINGAGLAMATMDMIKLVGGAPANFLDIGGGASPERVLEAVRVVLLDSGVRAMLINIFAGVNRCTWVAQGIVAAFHAVDVRIPVVVRLAGTEVDGGREILRASRLPIITADTLAEAAERAVAAARSAEDVVSSGRLAG
jgi:malate-CoA ligase subunit beta